MEENSLQINIEAIDDASEIIQGVSDEAATMADAISESVLQANESFGSMEESITALNEVMSVDSAEISDDAIAIGTSFDEAAAMIATGATEAETAMGEEGVAGAATSLKSSFMQIGIVASVAFLAVKNEVQDALKDAQQWNQSIQLIQQELKDTGSALPIDQITAYANKIQDTTLFTSQSSLTAESQILSFKDLQGQYKEITDATADLATRMRGDMPAAAQVLTNALEDPITGLSKLSKAAGVDFSPANVMLIDALAKSGATAQADAKIFEILEQGIGGAATAARNAPGSGMTELWNELNRLNILIGQDLAPVLDKLADAIMPIVKQIEAWVQLHPQLTAYILLGTLALTGLLAVFVVLGIAISAIITSLGAFATIFVAIFGGGGEIVAAMVIVGTFAAYVISQWGDIKGGAIIAFNDLMTFMKTWWSDMQGGFSVLYDWINNNFIKPLTSAINAMINSLSSIGKSISGGASGAWNDVKNFVGGAINAFADGGIVTSPQLALVGEAGPEAIIPLSMLGGGSSATLGGAGQGGINVYITGTVMSTADQARLLGNEIARQIGQSIRLQSFK